MRLLATYFVIVFVVGYFAVQLGFQLDHISPMLAVPIALFLYFGVLVVGWPIAIFVTDHWLGGKTRRNGLRIRSRNFQPSDTWLARHAPVTR